MAAAGRDSGAFRRRGAAHSSAEHERRFRSQLLPRKEQARRAAPQNGARSPPRPPSNEFAAARSDCSPASPPAAAGRGPSRTHAVSEPDCPAARTLSARCARAPCAFVPAWPNLEGSHAQLAGICLLHRLPALQHSSCLMAGFSQHARTSRICKTRARWRPRRTTLPRRRRRRPWHAYWLFLALPPSGRRAAFPITRCA